MKGCPLSSIYRHFRGGYIKQEHAFIGGVVSGRKQQGSVVRWSPMQRTGNKSGGESWQEWLEGGEGSDQCWFGTGNVGDLHSWTVVGGRCRWWICVPNDMFWN